VSGEPAGAGEGDGGTIWFKVSRKFSGMVQTREREQRRSVYPQIFSNLWVPEEMENTKEKRRKDRTNGEIRAVFGTRGTKKKIVLGKRGGRAWNV